MAIRGCISHRDEDGTWYLVAWTNDFAEWSQAKSDAEHGFTPEQAEPLMEICEQRGKYFVRYTASRFAA